MADSHHAAGAPLDDIQFETHPSRYRHWKLTVDGETARLALATDTAHALRPGYELKLNSYDLAVDIELADAVERLRFEHPAVKVVVVTSDRDRIFCSGANIFMLASSSHPFKVNFCKFTNETRLSIEDASRQSGQRYLAAISGPCAGGGYELALACDEIILVEDGSSTVSLPEVPLLGVLPGTGGLTRVVDKRKVRRDLADVFSTTAEGVKGKRAVEWGLVDHSAPRSKFADLLAARTRALAATAHATPRGPGITLPPLERNVTADGVRWRHVELRIDRTRRVAELTLHAPQVRPAEDPASIRAAGAAWWPLQLSRELDEALLRLRFLHEDIGLVLLRTRGDAAARDYVRAADQALSRYGVEGGVTGAAPDQGNDWFVREVRLHLGRTLRRLDLTGRSLFAVIDPGSCWVGFLYEIALAADRQYMLEQDGIAIELGALHGGALPMPNDLSRLATRFLADPAQADRAIAAAGEPLDADRARALGLVTVAADDIDFDDELRVAVEERASLSPDSLTGMEASLRFAGPETMATKIFGRLSAWQNWIFTRPNATGPTGALTLYGRPERPEFDFRRT